MADPSPFAPLVARVPLFAALSEVELRSLVAVLEERRLAAGEVLFTQGEPGDALVIVASGRLDVRMKLRAGGEGRVAALGAGDFVGEMACLDPAPRTATVVARELSTVLALDRGTVRGLQAHAPSLAVALVRAVIGQLSRRLRALNERVQRLVSSGAWRAPARPPRVAPPVVAGADTTAAAKRLDLRTVPFLREFPEADLRDLLTTAPPQRQPAGALLCREGDPGDSCFVLVHGAVDVFRTQGGAERLLTTLAAGTLIGHMALVDEAIRSASVRTREPSAWLEIRRADFERLLAASSPFAIRFQEQVAIAGIRQLRAADEYLASLERAPAEAGAAVAQAAARAADVAADPASIPLAEDGDGGSAGRGRAPRVDDEALRREVLAEHDAARDFLETALTEWGMAIEDLAETRRGG